MSHSMISPNIANPQQSFVNNQQALQQNLTNNNLTNNNLANKNLVNNTVVNNTEKITEEKAIKEKPIELPEIAKKSIKADTTGLLANLLSNANR